MISHLGPQLAVADGIALAAKLRGGRKVTLVFTGDGGTSEGDFHEAINVASVWDLPVIFLIENNGYALSTPTNEQFRCEQLSARAGGYGIEGITIDGNDFFEVYERVKQIAESIRKKPRPVLIECSTFRMRGHEEASGTKYVPKALFAQWERRDPIARFERALTKVGALTKRQRETVRAELMEHIEAEVERAFAEPEVCVSVSTELDDVHARDSDTPPPVARSTASRTMRFVDAVSDGLREALRTFPDLVLMGQDIAEYGGVFKVTEGFLKEFGPARIRNTPLCESGILGAALGLSIDGMRSVVEMQFADFVSCGFNQIVNNLAKTHYRWGCPVNVVVRMPTGAGTGAGPFHSQSNEAWFTHVPGLKVVYPSTPADAKGLLLSAIVDPNPVMYFEHKALYRSTSGEVPEGFSPIPLGRARLARDGEQAVIISYGAAVHWAEHLLQSRPDLSVALLDLRTLLPLDFDAIDRVVRRVGRVLVFHEDTLFGGIGGEIAAYVGEHLFEHLDAPVVRVGSLDTPVPFAGPLEAQFLARARLEETLERLLSY